MNQGKVYFKLIRDQRENGYIYTYLVFWLDTRIFKETQDVDKYQYFEDPQHRLFITVRIDPCMRKIV